MSDPNIAIPFPVRGLSEDDATIAQEPRTTREMINTRVRDPKTGRNRGAQRVGTSRFSTTAVSGANPVRQMALLSYEQSRHTFAVNDDVGEVTVEWEKDSPSEIEAQRLATDTLGNVYIVHDKSRVTKYNPDGVVITSFHVPSKDTDHRVRSIIVGGDLAIYVATSTGPQNAESKIWKYEIDEEGDYQIKWDIDTVGFVPSMRIQRGLLYTLENKSTDPYPDGLPTGGLIGSASIVTYDSLTATKPRLRWERAVPFPANDIRVNDADEVIVCSGQNAKRGLSQGKDCSTASVFHTPDDIIVDDWDLMKWSWLDARTFNDLADGDEIRFWPDKSGNERHMFHWSHDRDDGGFFFRINPPKLSSAGLCDNATVRFDGRNGLASQDTRDVADSDNVKELNYNLLPAFSNTAWTAFFIIAPSVSRNIRGCVLEQFGEAKYRIITNEAYNIDPDDHFVLNPGKIRWAITPGIEFSGGSAGVFSHQPIAGTYVQDLITQKRDDVTIVVLRHIGDDLSGSKFRVNGVELDDFQINREQSMNPTLLGFTHSDEELPVDFSEVPDHFVGDIAEIVVVRDLHTSQGDSKIRPITDNEIIRMEGYLAHRWGIQHLLDSGHAHRTVAPGSVSGGSSGLASGDASGVAAVLKATSPIVAKYGPNGGDIIWAYTGSGVGYAVALDSDGDVYTVGPQVFRPSGGVSGDLNTGGYNATVRKITDNGTSFTLTWQLDSWDVRPVQAPVQIEVDAEKNLYVPHFRDTQMPSGGSSSVGQASLYKITAAGAIEWGFSIDASAPPAGEDATLLAYDVKLDPRTFDSGNTAIKEPEFCYIVTRTTGGEETLHKIRLLTATSTVGALRQHRVVCAASNDVRTITPSTGVVNTPTGSTNILDSNAQYISMATLFQQVFISDGEGYFVYDPVLDSVVAYEPTSAGEPLARCKLLTVWSDRLIFARPDGDAHNWLMASKGDPYNVDLAPPVTLDTQAVVGNDSRAGVFPDICNALVPYSDDLLLVGGDSSIHRMTGDPLAGGVFDLVTDAIGMAFGTPWAKDPSGILYFFGSKGSIYAMVPDRRPQPISEAIEERLRAVNLTTHTTRLAWDWKNECLDVFVVPYGSSSATTHFCWEKETRAWSETTFSNTNMEPHSLMVFDGDAEGDRVTLIGCSDGFVRKWDSAAANDDDSDNDYLIDSQVLLGPFSVGLERDLRLNWLSMNLSSQQQGARLEILASDSPEVVPTTAVVSIRIPQGRSGKIRERARGMAVWFRLRNARVSERWAMEHGSMNVVQAGRLR